MGPFLGNGGASVKCPDPVGFGRFWRCEQLPDGSWCLTRAMPLSHTTTRVLHMVLPMATVHTHMVRWSARVPVVERYLGVFLGVSQAFLPSGSPKYVEIRRKGAWKAFQGGPGSSPSPHGGPWHPPGPPRLTWGLGWGGELINTVHSWGASWGGTTAGI